MSTETRPKNAGWKCTTKTSVWFIVISLAVHTATLADDVPTSALPFDRRVINRYSLDHLPRSVSIRQNSNVWLGYDLERASIYKVWQSPPEKSGLIPSGFRVRSSGRALFEDKSNSVWTWEHETTSQPMAARYLGISQLKDAFQLTWELQHKSGVVILVERVPFDSAESTARVVREIRIQRLMPGDRIRLPTAVLDHWQLTSSLGATVEAIADSEWHRLTLAPTVSE